MCPLVNIIEGRELATVTFVRDYVQLGFDGPVITLINNFTIISGSNFLASTDSDCSNLLVSLTGETVGRLLIEESKQLELHFSSGTRLSVSLKSEDYRFGPEAVIVSDGKQSLVL